MIKKTIGYGLASAFALAALLTGPNFNFSSISKASAGGIIVVCSDGSTPNCVPVVINGKAGVFCSCG